MERVQGDRAANGRDPLYARVARTLRDEILSGLHPIGGQLPTEDELCTRFAVSRHTIREALRRLRDDQLVSSRQGAGTVVSVPRPANAQPLHATSIDDLASFAAETRFVIETIGIETMTDDLAAVIRVSDGGGKEWLTVRGHRRSRKTSEPLCWAEYHIARRYAGVARMLPRHTGPIFPLLEGMFAVGIAEVEQEVAAIALPANLAAGLDVPTGAVALEVRRIYRTADGAVVQATINTHPAAQFTHRMTMRRVGD